MSDAVKPVRRAYGSGRVALLEAAVAIGAERGLRGLTLRAVAERAGVDNALVVRHFGGRDGLLQAALDWSSAHANADVDLAKFRNDPVAYVIELTAEVEREPEQLVFQYEMILEAYRDPSHRPAVARLYRNFFEALAPADLDTDPALTRARFAALDGLVIQRLSGAISMEEFRDSVMAVLRVLGEQGAQQQS